jgi:hypothetical protein
MGSRGIGYLFIVGNAEPGQNVIDFSAGNLPHRQVKRHMKLSDSGGYVHGAVQAV